MNKLNAPLKRSHIYWYIHSHVVPLLGTYNAYTEYTELFHQHESFPCKAHGKDKMKIARDKTVLVTGLNTKVIMRMCSTNLFRSDSRNEPAIDSNRLVRKAAHLMYYISLSASN